MPMLRTLLQKLRILRLETGDLFGRQCLAEGYRFIAIGRYLPAILSQALGLSFYHLISQQL